MTFKNTRKLLTNARAMLASKIEKEKEEGQKNKKPEDDKENGSKNEEKQNLDQKNTGSNNYTYFQALEDLKTALEWKTFVNGLRWETFNKKLEELNLDTLYKALCPVTKTSFLPPLLENPETKTKFLELLQKFLLIFMDAWTNPGKYTARKPDMLSTKSKVKKFTANLIIPLLLRFATFLTDEELGKRKNFFDKFTDINEMIQLVNPNSFFKAFKTESTTVKKQVLAKLNSKTLTEQLSINNETISNKTTEFHVYISWFRDCQFPPNIPENLLKTFLKTKNLEKLLDTLNNTASKDWTTEQQHIIYLLMGCYRFTLGYEIKFDQKVTPILHKNAQNATITSDIFENYMTEKHEFKIKCFEFFDSDSSKMNRKYTKWKKTFLNVIHDKANLNEATIAELLELFDEIKFIWGTTGVDFNHPLYFNQFEIQAITLKVAKYISDNKGEKSQNNEKAISLNDQINQHALNSLLFNQNSNMFNNCFMMLYSTETVQEIEPLINFIGKTSNFESYKKNNTGYTWKDNGSGELQNTAHIFILYLVFYKKNHSPIKNKLKSFLSPLYKKNAKKIEKMLRPYKDFFDQKCVQEAMSTYIVPLCFENKKFFPVDNKNKKFTLSSIEKTVEYLELFGRKKNSFINKIERFKTDLKKQDQKTETTNNDKVENQNEQKLIENPKNENKQQAQAPQQDNNINQETQESDKQDETNPKKTPEKSNEETKPEGSEPKSTNKETSQENPNIPSNLEVENQNEQKLSENPEKENKQQAHTLPVDEVNTTKQDDNIDQETPNEQSEKTPETPKNNQIKLSTAKFIIMSDSRLNETEKEITANELKIKKLKDELEKAHKKQVVNHQSKSKKLDEQLKEKDKALKQSSNKIKTLETTISKLNDESQVILKTLAKAKPLKEINLLMLMYASSAHNLSRSLQCFLKDKNNKNYFKFYQIYLELKDNLDKLKQKQVELEQVELKEFSGNIPGNIKILDKNFQQFTPSFLNMIQSNFLNKYKVLLRQLEKELGKSNIFNKQNKQKTIKDIVNQYNLLLQQQKKDIELNIARNKKRSKKDNVSTRLHNLIIHQCYCLQQTTNMFTKFVSDNNKNNKFFATDLSDFTQFVTNTNKEFSTQDKGLKQQKDKIQVDENKKQSKTKTSFIPLDKTSSKKTETTDQSPTPQTFSQRIQIEITNLDNFITDLEGELAEEKRPKQKKPPKQKNQSKNTNSYHPTDKKPLQHRLARNEKSLEQETKKQSEIQKELKSLKQEKESLEVNIQQQQIHNKNIKKINENIEALNEQKKNLSKEKLCFENRERKIKKDPMKNYFVEKVKKIRNKQKKPENTSLISVNYPSSIHVDVDVDTKTKLDKIEQEIEHIIESNQPRSTKPWFLQR